METKTPAQRSNSNSRSNVRRPSTGGSSYRGNTSRSRGGRSFRGNRSRRRGGRKMPSFDPSQFINKNPVQVEQEVYTPTHTFDTFGVNQQLADTIKKMGLITPSPIQDQVIPEILQGHDVVGLAETGTGKTAAFLIPIIEKTLKNRQERTLILTPTRELAIQIESELRKLSQGLKIFSTTCVGGVPIRIQIRGLKRLNHCIIGTPGRILDLIERKELKLESFTNVVLDEADRMLDMGFIGDIRKILSETPKERNTLFFSATMAKEVEVLISDFLRNPVTISVKKKDVTNSIEQDIVECTADNKFETLMKLLEDPELQRVLVFCGMKHTARRLAEDIKKRNVKSESIHGNKTHGQRQQALKLFKSGNARVLVATDVAARGIHVDNVTHVINYDLPTTFDDYVHRIGRTGRGTKRGKALTFVPKR